MKWCPAFHNPVVIGQLKKGRSWIDVSRKIVTPMVVRHWHKLPREALDNSCQKALQRAGTPPAPSDCSAPSKARSWMSTKTGHPPPLYATCSSSSLPLIVKSLLFYIHSKIINCNYKLPVSATCHLQQKQHTERTMCARRCDGEEKRWWTLPGSKTWITVPLIVIVHIFRRIRSWNWEWKTRQFQGTLRWCYTSKISFATRRCCSLLITREHPYL